MRGPGADRHAIPGVFLAVAHPSPVVVLRALGLGDLLAGLPALRALRDAFAGDRITLVTTPNVHELASLLDVADQIVAVRGLEPLPVAPAPATAVNLHGRGPESHRLLLAARPGRLIAFASQAAGVTGPHWQPGEHEVHRWCRMLTEHGIPADPSRLDLPPPPVQAPAIARDATIIHPGAASGARRWPAARWADVARNEVATGRNVVLTGSLTDWHRCQHIAMRAGLPPEACLAGRTSVVELAGVVCAAGLVLSGDTGIAHLATALNRPSVVLFGPVPPSEWGPPPDRPRHIALWAGQRGDPHGDRVDPGLLAITVDEVLAAADRARAASGRLLP